MTNKIPKRIIQTGKNHDLPLMARAAAQNLKCQNSDFEYLFFDDEAVNAFIDQEFPQYRSVFDGFPLHIQRFDFFRYLAVYRYGGFYFDLDVFLATNLEELLSLSCVFPFEELTMNSFLRSHYGIDWEMGNYAFGAAPGHPFLKAVIENCVRAQKEPKWVTPMLKGVPFPVRSELHVLNTTGPGLLTRTLADNPQMTGSVTILFPDDVCDMESWHQFGSLGVHLMNGTWRERGGFVGSRLAWMWARWCLKRSVAASRKLGKTRPYPLVAGVRESANSTTRSESVVS